MNNKKKTNENGNSSSEFEELSSHNTDDYITPSNIITIKKER